MAKIKIGLIALSCALLLTGCADSEKMGTSDPETLTVSGSAGATDPEKSNNSSSVMTIVSNDPESTGTDTSGSTALPDPAPTERIQEANEMKIIINGKEFSAKFHDTKAAEEFKAMLPMTLDMSELNGNEKYIYIDDRLTAAGESVGHIDSGDIMLYGTNCIVLFYDSFSTPYSYTRIGHIEDTAGLEKALGSGDVTVEFR